MSRKIGDKVRIKLPKNIINSGSNISLRIKKDFEKSVGKIVTIKTIERILPDYCIYTFEEGGKLSDSWIESVDNV